MFDINFLNKPGLQIDNKQSVISFESNDDVESISKESLRSENKIDSDYLAKNKSTEKRINKASGYGTQMFTFFGFIILFLFLLYNDISSHFSLSDSLKIKEFLSNAIYNEPEVLLSSIDQDLKQTKIILQSENNLALINFYNSYLIGAGKHSRFFKLNEIFHLEIKVKNNGKKLSNNSAKLKQIVNQNSIGDNILISQEFESLFIKGKFQYLKHIVNDIFEKDYFIKFNFKNSGKNSSLVFFNME
tara:strand:- start:523 stop:1257 length:735 start_codon:yes stop_codon:yes gene_type:complete